METVEDYANLSTLMLQIIIFFMIVVCLCIFPMGRLIRYLSQLVEGGTGVNNNNNGNSFFPTASNRQNQNNNSNATFSVENLLFLKKLVRFV